MTVRYIVRKSYVWVLGRAWLPAVLCGQRKELSDFDIKNLVAEADGGPVEREDVERWLTANSGDFSQVIDFAASLEIGKDTVEISWGSEENEVRYNDLYADGDDDA